MALDFSLKPATSFAPAERATIDRVKSEQTLILGNGATAAVLETMRDPVAIVNDLRQIVHANSAFLGFAAVKEVDEILGMRLGEFIGCGHAVGDMAGCGTHEACRTCGAVNAVVRATEGLEMSSEVDLTVECGGRERRLCFEITASPLRLDRQTFVLMTIHKARWAAAKG